MKRAHCKSSSGVYWLAVAVGSVANSRWALKLATHSNSKSSGAEKEEVSQALRLTTSGELGATGLGEQE